MTWTAPGSQSSRHVPLPSAGTSRGTSARQESEEMRYLLYGVAVLGLLATIPTPTLAGALACAAGALFEATPFLIGGALLAHFIGRDWPIAYAGCGCGRGPSARSLPAALATCLVFGPFVAVLRVIAATLVARYACRIHAHAHSSQSILDELASLLPSAAIAGIVLQLSPLAMLRHAPVTVQFLAGALFGFAAAPCALGAVAIAGALHAQAPMSTLAFLCIAGIADVRTWSARFARPARDPDACAYAVLGIALAIVAWRRGDALVHPIIAPFLGICALVIIARLIRNRRASNPRMLIAPAVMLAGALIIAPAPTYHATETTLDDAFPSERLNFTGVVVHHGGTTALVRYAITCCRADAMPVVVRLAKNVPYAAHTWLTVDGTLVREHDELRLAPQSVRAIAPPADPFVYR